MTFKASSFADKTVAVFGLGRSGLATVAALVAGGAKVLAYDDNEKSCASARDAGIDISDLKLADFSAIDALVLAPGVPLTHPEPHWTVKKAQNAGVEIIGDVEIFAREIAGSGARMVAITGTNGKSTTTALIGHILHEAGCDVAVGGNIGTAVFLLPPPTLKRIYVLELSSYQIDLMPSLKPDVGILLNLAPDHLDRHGNMANYAAVKARMFSKQTMDDVAIVSVDDRYCAAISEAIHGPKLMPISVEKQLSSGVSAVAGNLVHQDDGTPVTEINLKGMSGLRGSHNWQNACAAYAATKAMELTVADIYKGMESFPGLAHRMEEIADKDGVLFINDSKATNTDAAERALASFKNIYWIAGGRAKEGGIDALQDYFSTIKQAFLIGEAAKDFADRLEGHCPVVISGTIEQAVSDAALAAFNAGGGVVLFSPACASFDQYPNFEVRGDAFRDAVAGLAGVDVQLKGNLPC